MARLDEPPGSPVDLPLGGSGDPHRVGWVDASAGASGDMLLGALLDVGVPLEVVQESVDAVSPEPVILRATTVTRAGLRATRCIVEVAESTVHRGWPDVAALLEAPGLAEPVRDLARAVFRRLATAEAAVHGVPVADVHFHEVGALDAIADVVGTCAGFHHLGLASLTVSPVAVGSGRVAGEHGSLPVPVPAVTELLRGRPSYAGPGAGESCTPTGAALLAVLATGSGPQPPMTVTDVGVGAGRRDPGTHANVVRLLAGTALASEPPRDAVVLETNVDAVVLETNVDAVVLETNVDDLDPRLWPGVLAALLDAGASDAWLTPILMKKGRPAHTLSVLGPPGSMPALRRAVFAHTSTIGVRETTVAKTALDRETHTVQVAGRPVRVKVARLDGAVTNLQPEYDDVAAAARATGRPVRELLDEAHAVARGLRL